MGIITIHVAAAAATFLAIEAAVYLLLVALPARRAVLTAAEAAAERSAQARSLPLHLAAFSASLMTVMVWSAFLRLGADLPASQSAGAAPPISSKLRIDGDR